VASVGAARSFRARLLSRPFAPCARPYFPALFLTPVPPSAHRLCRLCRHGRFHGFETVQRLFAHISALQAGDAPDPHGYRHVVAL